MPREDETYRNIQHAPYCTCADCVQKRLKKLGYKKRKPSSNRLHVSNRIKKVFLYLFLVLCVLTISYSAYLIYKGVIGFTVGIVIIIFSIVLLIWDIILLNRYWVRNGAFVAIFLVVVFLCAATGAYAGFEPLSNVKDKVSAWVSNSTTESNEVTPKPTTTPKQVILKQYFLAGYFIAPKVIELNEVQRWLYSSSKQLTFRSINPPYVVNAAIRTQTSQVATSLEVRVYRKDDPYKTSDIPITTRSIPGMGGVQAFIIQEKGDYIIDVKSVGCEYWVMVGHESEAYRQ